MGVGNDVAVGGLAEHFGEANDGDDAAGDDVAQDRTGTDGGELVDVADEDEIGVRGKRARESAHERDIDHAHFIDDDEVSFERIGSVAVETFGGLNFEETMDGEGIHAGAFTESLGGATGGGAEKTLNFFSADDREDGIEQSGFADAGSTSDDKNAIREGRMDGGALGFAKLFAGFLFGPIDGLGNVDGRIVRGLAADGAEAERDGFLGGAEAGEENEIFLGDQFVDEFALLEEAHEGLSNERGREDENLLGFLQENVTGQRAMAIGGGFGQDVFKAGGSTHNGIARNADFLGDFIGGFESDAGDVASEKVRILADAFDGAFAVSFIDADGAGGADSMGMEKDHDFANDFLFSPGVFDAFAAAGPDAVDFFEALREVLDDAEDFLAKLLDELLSVFGSDPFNHAAAEIPLDAFAGGGRNRAEFLGAEFEAVVFVVDPVTLGGEPFAGSDGGEGTDDGNEIAATLGFDLENSKSGFITKERDAFDETSDRFDGLLVRLILAGSSLRVHRGPRAGLANGRIWASVIDGGKVKRRVR